MKKRHYIYTNKKHSLKGVFSFILAVISLISIVLTVIVSYKMKGSAPASFGAVGVLACIFSGVGIVLALYGKQEPDTHLIFSNLGLYLNIVNLLCISAILYAGT